MTTPNPYAPPQAEDPPRAASGVRAAYGDAEYVPLGWRTILASVFVFATVLCGATLDVLLLILGERLKEGALVGTRDYTDVLILAGMSLLSLAVSIGSWISVGMWLHRAASNLRGLGRYGMAFSPAACIAWFFVPVANLWKPLQAVGELWRASDPTADQGSWVSSPGTPLLATWWSAWMLASFISVGPLLARGMPASAVATIGLTAKVFSGVAAVGLVGLMRGIASRQAQAATRMQAPMQ
jgi:hypothetical protein